MRGKQLILFATPSQSRSIKMHQNNSMSTSKISGYIGVRFHKYKKLWEAYVDKDGKRISGGFFTDPKDAAIERDDLAVELYGDKAKLNFPKHPI